MKGPTGDVIVSDSHVEAFKRDGVICLRAVFGQYWLDLVARGIERNIVNPGVCFRELTPEHAAGRFLTDMSAWFHVPEFREYAFRSPLAAIAGRVLASERPLFVEDNWFLREAGTTSRTPWHQDQPYYDIEGALCSVWMPLESVTRADGIEFVRGSHLWGDCFLPTHFHNRLPQGEEGEINGRRYRLMPDIEADRAGYDIVSWEMESGDCVVFTGATVHGACDNTESSRTIRRMSTRWAARDALFVDKGLEWSSLSIGHGLRSGDALECDTFPAVPPPS